MKISLKWLTEYLNTDLTADQLAETLTQTGLEVSSVETYENFKGGLEGFVVGEVLEAIKHPNADKLKLTKINIGTDTPLNVVCGAPNVEVGQKVVLATIGTKIYTSETEFFTIQKSKIRGEVSEGMLCSETEIGLSKKNDGILVLDSSVAAGTLLKNHFNVYQDHVLEVELTPNRGDAASHIGVARDIYAALYTNDQLDFKKPDVSAFKIDVENQPITVEIQDSAACPRYAGLYVSNLEVKESPAWLKDRLVAVGLRPINNVVDISNYVMHETGQPLHAFDAAKISGQRIVVKTYPEGTKFKTLDGVERSLLSKDLIISDTQKPMCIAGVFGGLESGVSVQTKEIFLESACFAGSVLRKTSKHHNLYTDASFRYERDTDIEMVDYALKRAALLLKEIAGAKIHGPMIDIYPAPKNKTEVTLRWSELYKIMGIPVSQEISEKILIRLGFTVEKYSEGLKLNVPTNKTDVTREIDVIEEIARVYGLNNIPVSQHLSASIENKTFSDESEQWKEKTRAVLQANGYFEAMNNSLISNNIREKYQPDVQPVSILNPLSGDLNCMRTSMVYSLLENVSHNQKRNQKHLRFFEFGSIYQKKDAYIETDVLSICLSGQEPKHWKIASAISDFFTLKSACSIVFERMGLLMHDFDLVEQKNSPIFSEEIHLVKEGKSIGILGRISQELAKEMDVDGDVYFAELLWNPLFEWQQKQKSTYRALNKFPEVVRDLALLVPENVKYGDLKKLAFETEQKILKSVDIFDVYQGKNLESGKKSYALRFILEDTQQTLKEEQIDRVMKSLATSFQEKHQAQVRS